MDGPCKCSHVHCINCPYGHEVYNITPSAKPTCHWYLSSFTMGNQHLVPVREQREEERGVKRKEGWSSRKYRQRAVGHLGHCPRQLESPLLFIKKRKKEKKDSNQITAKVMKMETISSAKRCLMKHFVRYQHVPRLRRTRVKTSVSKDTSCYLYS